MYKSKKVKYKMHHRFMCKKLWKSSWTDWIHKTLLLCCTDKYFIVAVYVSIYICISAFLYIYIPFSILRTLATPFTRRIEGFQNTLYIFSFSSKVQHYIYTSIDISISIYICTQTVSQYTDLYINIWIHTVIPCTKIIQNILVSDRKLYRILNMKWT